MTENDKLFHMKKYALTDETLEIGMTTLHRIKALVAFADVEIGDTGGWVEKESNLDQNGDAWIYGNARVCGNAYVYDNAHYMTISPIGSRNDTITFARDKQGRIFANVGCFYGSLSEFRAKVRNTHGDNNHAKAYLLAAQLAELRLDTTPIKTGTEDPTEVETDGD